jgi:small subunit ribosomal protein S3
VKVWIYKGDAVPGREAVAEAPARPRRDRADRPERPRRGRSGSSGTTAGGTEAGRAAQQARGGDTPAGENLNDAAVAAAPAPAETQQEG